ncbi:hypothetical protein [Streptomyces sp. NPDC057686]|uniref:hypothetical protein n=1 Tax=Streptomyces sp. NPDC057686 TaxID=3346212 RepID=UPI0036BAC5EF
MAIRAPKCEHERCSQPLTEWGCREVAIGSYCRRWGLWRYKDGYVTYPDPDPIGRAEQKIIDANAEELGGAEKAVDELLQAHREARRRLDEASLACLKAGVAGPKTPMLQGLYGGPSGVQVDPRHRATGRQAVRLLEAEDAAREAVAELEHQLDRARGRLQQVERRVELSRRVARRSD